MTRLDNYRKALLAASPDADADELCAILDRQDTTFARFVIDHGLGPMWHERTGRDEFRESRLQAEALFLVQREALQEIDQRFSSEGIEYVVFKGAANRSLLYDNPAIRACHDIDVLVRPQDRFRAAVALTETGFFAVPELHGIGRGIVMRRRSVDVDLHWKLLRSGRLRREVTGDILSDRQRVADLWVPSAEDALFILLVHPAFTKHLASWDMGLHRVADLVLWLGRQETDLSSVLKRLAETGVQTAAWATLTWAQLLMPALDASRFEEILGALEPGPVRRAWLRSWLTNEWPSRSGELRWFRLLAYSAFLHDSVLDLARVAGGRYKDMRRAEADLAEFDASLGQ